MRDLIVCGDNSWNLIFYDPRLDRFSNCVFSRRSLHEHGSGRSAASVVGVGSSRSPLGRGFLLHGLRPLIMLDGIFDRD
jgi:hypothetical protein